MENYRATVRLLRVFLPMGKLLVVLSKMDQITNDGPNGLMYISCEEFDKCQEVFTCWDDEYEIYPGLSLVELLHYCPLIGRELHSVASPALLCHKEPAQGNGAPYNRFFLCMEPLILMP